MIVLDTHIWVNWILLGETVPVLFWRQWIPQSSMAISAISCFEVSLLVKQGKTGIATVPVHGMVFRSTIWIGCRMLAGYMRDSAAVGCAPERAKDPADRTIIATAIVFTMPCWRASTLSFLPIQKSLGA